MKRSTLLRAVFFLLCSLLVLIFIFSNSMEDTPTSKSKSDAVYALIAPVLDEVFGVQITRNMIRKTAHIVEFGVLGLMTSYIFLTFCKKSRYGMPLLGTLFIGLLAALADETIQIYTERGAQVTDVWIDFIGVVIGALLGLFISKIIHHFRKS